MKKSISTRPSYEEVKKAKSVLRAIAIERLEQSLSTKKDKLKLAKNIARILERNKDAVIPEIGGGANYGAGSDSYPATIIEVSPTLDYVVIQNDDHTPTAKHDFYSNQDYTYTINPNGGKRKYTLRKNGRYIADGQPLKAYYSGVGFGERRYYIDPHF